MKNKKKVLIACVVALALALGIVGGSHIMEITDPPFGLINLK